MRLRREGLPRSSWRLLDGARVMSLPSKRIVPPITRPVPGDIQDVGARFFTYISTMHYLMEACAEHGKELMVLDRPNPNDYVDGPVRQPGFESFVGVHPIPVLHGKGNRQSGAVRPCCSR